MNKKVLEIVRTLNSIFFVVCFALICTGCTKSEPTTYRTWDGEKHYRYWLTQQSEVKGEPATRNMLIGDLFITTDRQADNSLVYSIRLGQFTVRVSRGDSSKVSTKRIDLTKLVYTLKMQNDGTLLELKSPENASVELGGTLQGIRQSLLDLFPALPKKLALATAWSRDLTDTLPLPGFGDAGFESKMRLQVNEKLASDSQTVWKIGGHFDMSIGGDEWMTMKTAPDAPPMETVTEMKFFATGGGKATYHFSQSAGRIEWAKIESDVNADTAVKGEINTTVSQRTRTVVEIQLKNSPKMKTDKQPDGKK